MGNCWVLGSADVSRQTMSAYTALKRTAKLARPSQAGESKQATQPQTDLHVFYTAL